MKKWTNILVNGIQAILFLLVALAGTLAVYAFFLVREIDKTPADLVKVQADNTTVAEHVEAYLAGTQVDLATLAIRDDPSARERIQQRSRLFHAWLEGQQAAMPRSKIILMRPIGLTLDQATTLGDIRQALAVYEVQSQLLVAGSGPGDRARAVEKLAELRTQPLTKLANRARSEAGAIELFLAGSRRWYNWLRVLMLASVLTLTGLALGLAVLVYRHTVAPLRRRLVEAEAIVENQQKLAHFGELAAIVAHEIRNPLTAITMRLYTLQRALAEGSSEYADATVIGKEIQRLNRIVKDFLESARPPDPVLAPLIAETLFEHVHKLLVETCEKRAIELTIESIDVTPFLGDAHQLTQVLINLVQNAADSIQHDGAIKLRARRETNHLLHGKPTDVVLLEVEDTGPGIPREVQRRLFDPFYSTKPGGTGLGLSIAARIINRHGGEIEFESSPGQGTAFQIILPVHQTTL